MASIDYMNPMTAFGAGIVVSGCLFYKNGEDQKSKKLVSIVTILGIAIIAGGIYQSYTDYHALLEGVRYQKIFLSIPTEGKFGELFAIFREKIGVSHDNFLDSGSSFAEKPAMWGFDQKKWHRLFLQAKYIISERARPTPVTIELIQDPLDSQGVISNVSLLNSQTLIKELNEYLVKEIGQVVPKVIDEFSRFLDGERIYEGGFYNLSSLQIC